MSQRAGNSMVLLKNENQEVNQELVGGWLVVVGWLVVGG